MGFAPCMRSRSLCLNKGLLYDVGAFIAVPRLKGLDFMGLDTLEESDLEVEVMD